jgi:hypothetical protein
LTQEFVTNGIMFPQRRLGLATIINQRHDLIDTMKPANPPIDVPGCTPFQKMDNLFRAVVAVPKIVIDQREEQWQKAQAKKRKKVAKR